MELRQRRLVSRVVQLGLVVLAIALAASWVRGRKPRRPDIHVQVQAPDVQTLGPGDVQIFNVDSTVDLMLKADKIYAGLSPKTIAKIRSEIARDIDKDTSSLGGAIGKFVKDQVADKIGTRVVYDVADIRDIRYKDEKLIVEWKRGGEQALFGNVKVDDDKDSNRFRQDEAERFIAAVKARMP
jgi:hypothetical protein